MIKTSSDPTSAGSDATSPRASFIRESIAIDGIGGSTLARIAGIPCIEATQAEALFDEVGERDQRH